MDWLTPDIFNSGGGFAIAALVLWRLDQRLASLTTEVRNLAQAVLTNMPPKQ